MAILNATKRIHGVLGEIRFDDGKGDSRFGTQDSAPCWVARPMGWLSNGVEIYLSGDLLDPAPDSLARAIQAFKLLDMIEEEGKDIIHPIIINTPSPEIHATQREAFLLWVDCQREKTIVAFHWDGLPYVRWDATLGEANRIVDLQETTW